MILSNEDLLAISQIVDTRLDIRLKPIEQDIRELKSDVAELKQDVAGLKEDVESLKTGLHSVKLFQENIILPRLNTIESCYTDTYRRYQRNNDKMEAAFDDIDLLKKTVVDHGERLQKLA